MNQFNDDQYDRVCNENDVLCELLYQCGNLLWEHHECRVSALPPGTVCPICEKANIFEKIKKALDGVKHPDAS